MDVVDVTLLVTQALERVGVAYFLGGSLAALAGGARVLVSGDRKHLLPLKELAGIRIVDAATFAQELGRPGHPCRPGAVHEPVAHWGDGELALALEAKRWARARRGRAG